MLRKILIVAAAIALSVSFAAGADAARSKSPKVPRLKVSSDDIKRKTQIGEEQVANLFGCKGGNVSPEIKWSKEPAGIKSFAVTLYDPDAPTGSGFWHWVAFNIPADVHELAKGASTSMPAGTVQNHNDFSVLGYGGPCPPPGDKPHRYYLTVYAVDTDKLDGDANVSSAVVGFQLHFHTLARGTITAIYSRSK
jgi:Raf kinase inhibitor-like YbhB/YbcL family protein